MPASKPLGARIREAVENVREKRKWKNVAKRRKDASRNPEEYKRRVSILEKLRKALGAALERLKGLRAKVTRRPNWNGHPALSSSLLKKVVVEANKRGLYVTSTTGGTHSSTSWHYQRRAVDLAGPWSQMVAFQREAARRWPNALEIFGPDSFYVKNGQRYTGAFPDHGDHIHIAR
jgi:hypothetical protein